mmetsp:Transcript_24075/g.44468  ORF Transcript_24075/g.44468 Transcript_24075/m.44468 type:complete len:343 (+) Transcript_24075:1491-2519(+)
MPAPSSKRGPNAPDHARCPVSSAPPLLHAKRLSGHSGQRSPASANLALILTYLTTMQQQVIQDHTGHHRLTHRHRANAHTRVMASLGDHLGWRTINPDRLPRREDRAGRLHSKAYDHILTSGDTTQNTACMVRRKHRLAVVAHENLISIFRAFQTRRRHAFANLHAFHRVDRHHRRRQIGVQLAVNRRANPGGHIARHNLNHTADAVMLFAQLLQVVFPLLRHIRRLWNPEIIAVNRIPMEILAINLHRAHLGHVTFNLKVGRNRLDRLTRNTASSHARGCLTRRTTTAAAIITVAVFHMVGDVRVSGAERLADLAIIPAALIRVLDHQLDRRACGFTLKHT